TLDTTGNNGTTTRDREYVFDWHQERLVASALRLWNVAIQGFDQTLDSGGAHFVIVFAFQRHTSRTNADRGIVAWEIIGGQQVANFHLDQLQQLSVVYQVSLVQEDHDVRNANLTGQQDVLTGLRHRTISGRANQDSAIHLSSTGNHVFYIVG